VVDNQTALCYNYYISKETNIERIKMKNIVSILAVVAATATSVSAETTNASVNWVGTEVDLEDVCVFTDNQDGKMTYAENEGNGGGVWTVTKEALLKLSVRDSDDSSKLTVKAGNELYRTGTYGDQLTSSNHTQYGVTVDYTGSTVEVSRRHEDDFGKVVVARPTGSEFEVTSYSMGKHMEIKLGGTATMDYSGAYIDNGEYTITHEATCLQ
jgi:hypothetical protein